MVQLNKKLKEDKNVPGLDFSSICLFADATQNLMEGIV